MSVSTVLIVVIVLIHTILKVSVTVKVPAVGIIIRNGTEKYFLLVASNDKKSIEITFHV